MMYETRSRKPEPTLLLTRWIFNLPHYIRMVYEELAFYDAVSYTQCGEWIAAQLNVIAATGIRIHVPRVIYPTL